MTVSDDNRSDVDLVGSFLTGESGALAALYDRFAPGLYDTARAMLGDNHDAADVVQDVFCVAAAKLGQLRERDRVKPWLYAIARHEVFRRAKRRRRELPRSDRWDTPDGFEQAAPADPLAEGGAVQSAELAKLVREAARGLDPRDQLLLELTTRQGLSGDALAAAMGVTLAQTHSLVSRMRERVERAVGAYVVSRGDRRDCDELATVLHGWDGTFDVLWRKRIARHIDSCEQCMTRRRTAFALVGMAPAFAAPAWLRDAALARAAAAAAQPSGYEFTSEDGFPVPTGGGRRPGAGAAVGVSVAAVLTLAITLPMLFDGDDDTTASVVSSAEITSPPSTATDSAPVPSPEPPTSPPSSAAEVSPATESSVVVAPPPPVAPAPRRKSAKPFLPPTATTPLTPTSAPGAPTGTVAVVGAPGTTNATTATTATTTATTTPATQPPPGIVPIGTPPTTAATAGPTAPVFTPPLIVIPTTAFHIPIIVLPTTTQAVPA